jgi:4-amino-4-deoxy-L-arabinose transferase-like glycosyltransferase
MTFKIIKKNKFEYFILTIAVLLSLIWGAFNLNKFDKVKTNFDQKYFNQLLYADLNSVWDGADKFRKNLEDGNGYLESVPKYERFLLPSIIVGTYYYLIDEEIYEKKGNDQRVIKENNFKFGLLILQILFYFLSLFFFSKELKKIVSKNIYRLSIVFLAIEPSILQWHSSFWTESIFLSFMLILFTLILKRSEGVIINLFIGIILGLMFMQRAVSFLYFLPVLMYLIFIHKNKIKVYFLFAAGYLIVTLLVGLNNYKKTEHFFFLAQYHQYYSYYHYFAPNILADRKKISSKAARNILDNEEKKWLKENDIVSELNYSRDNLKAKDLSKIINYRNKIFLREVNKNKIYVFKKIITKTITMCIIHPLWVHNHFYFDKTDPIAITNPKKYYNKDLFKNIPYSLFIYFFVAAGIFKQFCKIYNKKRFNDFDKFLFFNIISILYFISISSLWGNPKYFAPCMVSLSFFFSVGFIEIKKKCFK